MCTIIFSNERTNKHMEEPLQCHCLYNSIVVVGVVAMVQAVSQKEAILLSEAPLSFLHFLPDPVSPVWDARIESNIHVLAWSTL